MTVIETILTDLLAALQGAQATIGRNTPLPDLAPANAATVGFVFRLLDGPEAEQTEAFINGGLYEFTARPVVQVIAIGGTDDAARDTAVDDAVAGFVGTLTPFSAQLADPVTDVRVQPANGVPKELWGAPGIKATEFTIEIDFYADNSAAA